MLDKNVVTVDYDDICEHIGDANEYWSFSSSLVLLAGVRQLIKVHADEIVKDDPVQFLSWT